MHSLLPYKCRQRSCALLLSFGSAFFNSQLFLGFSQFLEFSGVVVILSNLDFSYVFVVLLSDLLKSTKPILWLFFLFVLIILLLFFLHHGDMRSHARQQMLFVFAFFLFLFGRVLIGVLATLLFEGSCLFLPNQVCGFL
jgi:hypothetical protein